MFYISDWHVLYCYWKLLFYETSLVITLPSYYSDLTDAKVGECYMFYMITLFGQVQ